MNGATLPELAEVLGRLFCEAAALEAATIDQVTRLIAAVHEARSPCRDV